jgi:hypothetical protein
MKEIIPLYVGQREYITVKIPSPQQMLNKSPYIKENKLIWRLGFMQDGIILHFGPELPFSVIINDQPEPNLEKMGKGMKEKKSEKKPSKENNEKSVEGVRKKAELIATICGGNVEDLVLFIKKNYLQKERVEVILDEYYSKGYP